MTTRIIRDKILKHLKNDIYFGGIVMAKEINDTHYSAIDIALPENKNKIHVFRLVIAKHANPKSS